MRYEILDKDGHVVKGIIAEQAFVERYYPGEYRLIPDEPQEAPKKVVSLEEKVDRLIAALEKKGVIDAIAKD